MLWYNTRRRHPAIIIASGTTRDVNGAVEAVVHVLIDYPRLVRLRQEPRRKIGRAFSNISDMIGRARQRKEGRLNDAPQDYSALGTILDFAEALQRFQSRALQGR